MSILFGHPTGNPNAYNAALAHLEAGLLECFCVAWMPSTATIRALSLVPPLRPLAQRFARRHFAPLSEVSMVQGRVGEAYRLLMRASGLGDDRLIEEGNQWLMRVMAAECRRSRVRAVHAYEDCSLWQFMEAKRRGKACIYDMPTWYYAAKDKTQSELLQKYADWVPHKSSPTAHNRPREQKRQEMALADLTL